MRSLGDRRVLAYVAVAVSLLLPAQTLAHCGVPFAGLLRHGHHPAAAYTDAGGDVPDPALNAAPGDGSCTISGAVFATRPDGGPKAAPLPVSSLFPACPPTASALTSLGRGGGVAPVAPAAFGLPLRI